MKKMQSQPPRRASRLFETLESRTLLSCARGDGGLISWDAIRAGKLSGSGVRLDLVVLHELGHSLGLQHSGDSRSIMYAYYNPNYNLSNFSSDSAVTTLRNLYSNVSSSPWRDSLDPSPGNGRVDVTYSYVPDGTSLDKGGSRLFSALDGDMGRATWQNIITSDLNRWSSVSNGKIAFVSHSDSGVSFNFSGSVQNDSRAGDIRFGAHRFDGPGKTLAHTYYPPPTNSGTAAGDLHLDYAESWTSGSSAAITAAPAFSPTPTTSTTVATRMARTTGELPTDAIDQTV
jgi:hypothetical protein